MKSLKKLSILLLVALMISFFSFPVAAQPAGDAAGTTTGQDGQTATTEDGSSLGDLTYANMDPMNGFNLNTGFGILEGFTTSAKAAALYDLNSDSLIYSLEIDKQIYPASLTKLLCCLVAADYIEMDEMVTITPSAINAIAIEWDRTKDVVAGEVMPFYDLLHCILLDSSNESCNAVAEHVTNKLSGAPNIPEFVSMMNEKAKELGCTNTNCVNPHGLHETEHYTSVRDLILISREFLKNETLKEICYKINYMLPATNLQPERIVRTTNMLTSTYEALRYFYEPARGVKTGNTDAAGRNLISTAEHNGMNLLVIVTGCPTSIDDMNEWVLENFTEAKSLLVYGKKYFQYVTAFSEKTPVGEVTVENGSQESVFLLPAENQSIVLPLEYKKSDITTEITLNAGYALKAPFSEDDIVGTASIYYQGQFMDSVDVVPFTSVAERTKDISAEAPDTGFKLSFGLVLAILAGLLLIYYVISYVYLNINRRQRRKQQASSHGHNGNAQDPVIVTIIRNLLRNLRRRK